LHLVLLELQKIIIISVFPSQYWVISSGTLRNRKYWTLTAKRTALWLGAYERPRSTFPLFNALSRVLNSMQYLQNSWFAKICKNSRCEARRFLLATDTWNRFLYAGLRAFLSRWDICWNVSGDYVELRCVQFGNSVSYVQHIEVRIKL